MCSIREMGWGVDKGKDKKPVLCLKSTECPTPIQVMCITLLALILTLSYPLSPSPSPNPSLRLKAILPARNLCRTVTVTLTLTIALTRILTFVLNLGTKYGNRGCQTFEPGQSGNGGEGLGLGLGSGLGFTQAIFTTPIPNSRPSRVSELNPGSI